ncbi:MAG: amidohydrolase family protein [Thermoplasmata archaeon]|nr:MAG: amidohydrolase family protein [Thermoplasmata archaeon]
MDYVYGLIYENGSFKKGYLGFDNGTLTTSGTRVSKQIKSKALANGLIIPAFYNPHIHLADSFLYGQIPDSTIQELVAPQTGLKARKLKAASDSTIINATKSTVQKMLHTGTSDFIDFREMGVRGLNLLKKSMRGVPVNYKVLGRPAALRFDKSELNKIFKLSDGIGLSAFSDWDKDAITAISAVTHRNNKLFALHVSEAVREDIDEILDLNPHYIIHLIEATNKDLQKISEAKIPVVVCTRANMFFGKYPDLTAMVKAKIKLMLGTDNAMLTTPDMLQELANAFRCSKLTGGVPAKELLRIAFSNPREVFQPELTEPTKPLAEGNPANFLVLDVPELSSYAHPENLLCLGVSKEHITLISMNNFFWRRLK